MRNISGWVESIVLRRKAGDFFQCRGKHMKKTGTYWVIPLSSRIDKYKRIMEKKEKAGKPCDILHIVKLDDSHESAFLIQDMFPVIDEYIEREYTIAGNHLMLTSEHTARTIEQKARKVMGMLKRGVKFTPTQPDVMAILEKLQ